MSDTISNMKLDAADRCDRCGAQAYMHVQLPDGGGLLFCAHHADEFEPIIKAKGYQVHDERELLRRV